MKYALWFLLGTLVALGNAVIVSAIYNDAAPLALTVGLAGAIFAGCVVCDAVTSGTSGAMKSVTARKGRSVFRAHHQTAARTPRNPP